MKDRKDILDEFYNNSCHEETRLVTKHGSIEFLTTIKYIDMYLKSGDKILEVGAGTGKYSLHYAKQGYDVTSIELIERNLSVLKDGISNDMNIQAYQGDAIDLSIFDDNTFDVTLVLGPLYHLYNDEDINKAISEAIRVTKKSGIICIAYLTSDSIMAGWALHDNHLLDGKGKDFDQNYKMINYPEGLFAAFYIHEFKEIMAKYDVEYLKNIASDGMSEHFAEKIDSLTDEEFNVWLDYHYSTCEREELQGYSNHMLYICRKK